MSIKRLIFRTMTWACTRYARRRVESCGPGFTVNYPSFFTGKCRIGAYCHFNGISVVGSGRLDIGDYFHSGSDILVLTQNHNYRQPTKLPYDEADLPRAVSIGDYVWLGSRVTILPGAQLGDGCVVQAGAVVGGKFPPNAVIGGNPATILKYRDAERVAELVEAGKFLL